MYYKEISTKEVVQEEDAFLYAKEHLNDISENDRKEFIDWFFSGNWISRGDENEAEGKIN